MRTTGKLYIVVGILLAATATFLLLRRCQDHSANKISGRLPYPSLTEQRKSLLSKPFVTPYRILDSVQIVDDLKYLSSDECEGRGPGTKGHEFALQRVLYRMREIGMDSFNNSLVQEFKNAKNIHGTDAGSNVIGYIKGSKYPNQFIVVSAHYDHVGIIDGEIYHGASDNASGTACMLAIARYFKQNPLPYSLIIVAFDREETGLEGSKYFVNNLPVYLKQIKFNLNIDMIARNDSNEIFVCGVKQNPDYKYLVDQTQNVTNAKILMGHDDYDGKNQNWVFLGDHASFYDKRIPFLYIGVEDHEDLHQPSDTWDKIDLTSYIENCNMIVGMIKEIRL